MSAKVSTFLNVGGDAYRYTFLLVVWNDYADGVRNEINRHADAFGGDLGPAGLFVEPFPDRKYETAAEVLAKEWPEEVKLRMHNDADPILLILDHPFADFDPREHGYAIIWLSEYQVEPQQILPLLKTLARKTKDGDDVIGYLVEAAARSEQVALADEAGAAVALAARVASYIEVKPQIFGVSIDLKALLRDIANRG